MTRIFRSLCLFPLLALVFLAGCGVPSPENLPPPSEREIAALTQRIQALGPNVSPEEAARAARIAITYPRQLALEYQIEDPPYIHNIKVNNGTKPRGLCYQWADDMEARLERENFVTLDLHRAIANSDNAWRIEHSTVIVSAMGDSMWEGLVLDPWRNGGILYWGGVREDTKYPWKARQQVFAEKRERARLAQ